MGEPMASDEVPGDDAIAAELRRRAALGYGTDAEIVACMIETLQEEHGDRAGLAERVRRLAREAFAAQAALERSWPVPTDCDRLDRGFAALERSGIVARQHFSCCQMCGQAEIGDEVEAASAKAPVRGYTFFHMQDTAAAAAGGGLHLAYGAVMPEGMTEAQWNRAAVVVGHAVVAALRVEGLSATWSGDVNERIHVALTWRRRRRR